MELHELGTMEDVCNKHLNNVKKLGYKVSGYLTSKEDYDSFQLDLISAGFSFSTRNSAPYGNKTNSLFFESGFPCISIRRIYLECSHGNLYYKIGLNKSGDNQNNQSGKKTRIPKQSTKKMGCHSKLIVKVRHVFPEYGYALSLTNWQKTKISREVKKMMSVDCSDLIKETWYFIEAFVEHNHKIYGQQIPLHHELRSRITELVEDGITSVPVIKLHLNEKVEKMFDGKQVPDKSNTAFFPSDKVIYNQVHETMFSIKDSEFDKEALQEKNNESENVFENSLNQMIILNIDDNVTYDYLEQEDINIEHYDHLEQKQDGVKELLEAPHETPNHLVVLRKKLKNLVKMSYNIEDGEHLKHLVDDVLSIEIVMDTYQKKRDNLVLMETNLNIKKKNQQKSFQLRNELQEVKKRKLEERITETTVTTPSDLVFLIE